MLLKFAQMLYKMNKTKRKVYYWLLEVAIIFNTTYYKDYEWSKHYNLTQHTDFAILHQYWGGN